MSSKKWLLVLGANSDVGVAVAQRYASEGWSLYLASRDMESLEKEAANIRLRFDVDAVAFSFDVCDHSTHRGFYSSLSPKPDGVVTAFGYLGDQKTAQTSFEEAHRIVDVNYLGAISILEAVAKDFEERREGFIVGISSVAGDRGRASNYIYGSAKAAFTAYLSGLRHRLFVSGVHVLTVKPGFVKTKMTQGMDLPTRLLASPEAVAATIYKAVIRRKDTVYAKPVWRYIMAIIVHIPEFIFKKTKL
jgi:short-subunit dehydrogenase